MKADIGKQILERLDLVDGKLEELRKSTDFNFDGLAARMDRIDGRMDRIDGRMGSMEHRFDSFERRVIERFDGVDGRLDALERGRNRRR